MNIQKILENIPHRYPFLLVDRVLDFNKKEKTLKAIKNVTINEAFFTGHFPQRPIMPGVLMIEALAQACGLLATQCYPDEQGSLFLLASIGETKFKRIVEPGDQLLLDVQIISDRHKVLKCKARATVHDEVVCTTTLTSVRREVTMHD